MRRWGGLLLAGLLSFALTVHAREDLEPLRSLVEQGRVDAAYRWAVEHRGAYEGLATFDLYYGMAAIDSGHVAEGIFALERVLMHRPGQDRARLELARGYFLLGEDRRAKEEFRIVLAHDPPEAVEATVERFLEAIRRRADRYETVFTAYAELSAGYDTNVNSATDTDTVEIFGIPWQLNDASQEQADAFSYLSAGGVVKHPLSPSTGVYAGLDVRSRFHPEKSGFNTSQVAAHGGWEWRGTVTRLRLTGSGHRLFLDGEPYQDSLSGSAELRYAFTDTTAGTGFTRLSRLWYPDQNVRNSKLWTAGVGLSHLFLGAYQPALSLSLFGGQEYADEHSNAAEAVAERNLYGARAGLRFVLAPDWTLDLSAQARHSVYGAEHDLFGDRRRETYREGDLGFDWRFAKHWSTGPRIRYSHNEANITLYDYERTQAWVRLRYDHF